MTIAVVPTDELGINILAQNVTGFLDEADEQLQQSMMTTLFIAGSCPESQGRAAYMLLDDGSKLWMPNSLRCWLVDLKIVTQTYESFDPVDKLLVRVIAADGSSYVYRTSLNSWTASSFLQQFKYLTRHQLGDQLTISLVPKGRATFVNIQYVEKGLFHRVEIPKEEFGKGKMGYDDMLDAMSWANGTAQDNENSLAVAEQLDEEEKPFEVPPEELDELLDSIKSAD